MLRHILFSFMLLWIQNNFFKLIRHTLGLYHFNKTEFGSSPMLRTQIIMLQIQFVELDFFSPSIQKLKKINHNLFLKIDYWQWTKVQIWI